MLNLIYFKEEENAGAIMNTNFRFFGGDGFTAIFYNLSNHVCLLVLVPHINLCFYNKKI